MADWRDAPEDFDRLREEFAEVARAHRPAVLGTLPDLDALVRDVLTDYDHLCDNTDICECSFARLYRAFHNSAAGVAWTGRAEGGCRRCGVAVIQAEAHDEWHRTLGWGK